MLKHRGIVEENKMQKEYMEFGISYHENHSENNESYQVDLKGQSQGVPYRRNICLKASPNGLPFVILQHLKTKPKTRLYQGDVRLDIGHSAKVNLSTLESGRFIIKTLEMIAESANELGNLRTEHEKQGRDNDAFFDVTLKMAREIEALK